MEPLGVFTLVSANGTAAPAEVVHDGVTMTVLSGSMTFGRDRTCVSRMEFIPPGGTSTDRVVRATYTMRGSTLTLTWEGAGVTTGQLAGDVFTMDNEGLILVYRKGG